MLVKFIVFGGLMSLIPLSIVILRNVGNNEATWKNWAVETAIALSIGYALVGGMFLEAKADETAWNGGQCQCGGEWELVNVQHVKNGGEHYYYECEICDYVIDIGQQR